MLIADRASWRAGERTLEQDGQALRGQGSRGPRDTRKTFRNYLENYKGEMRL